MKRRIASYALIAICVCAWAVPPFLRYDAVEQDRENALTRPSAAHWLGTDALGRDVFTRTLTGARISISAAVVATVMALTLAAAAGSFAGYYGGWRDDVVMRASELFLALPWLYLLLAIRSMLPLSVTPTAAFALVVVLLGVLGWARPARLIRGVVLSARERDYVNAARGFGAGDVYVLRRHILPEATGVMTTQAALLAPRFILAEVTISFLGLGLAESTPGLGQVLADLRDPHVALAGPWMFAPAFLLLIIVVCTQAIADESDTL